MAKLLTGKLALQDDVPVAVKSTWLALEKLVPFQYSLLPLFLIEYLTLASGTPPVPRRTRDAPAPSRVPGVIGAVVDRRRQPVP